MSRTVAPADLPRWVPAPASGGVRGEEAVGVASNPLTQETNQPIQATPGCALLIFLAQVPGAPEPPFGVTVHTMNPELKTISYARKCQTSKRG